MAKPGPRTQPTAKRKLLGNPGKRSFPENEVQPDISDGVPPAPQDLDGVAKKEWGRMAAQLHKLGLLTNLDLSAFLAYCVCFGQWIDALEQIKKHGVLIKAQSGFPMQSPYLQIANRAMTEMRKWLVEFGMTPSSRAGLKADNPKPKSKADKFRARKNGKKGG